MKIVRRRLGSWAVLVGLALAGSGCQAWVPGVGMTLPSPWYLQHPPQYIPPTPGFPLPKEQATMEAQRAAAEAALPPPGAPAPPALCREITFCCAALDNRGRPWLARDGPGAFSGGSSFVAASFQLADFAPATPVCEIL